MKLAKVAISVAVVIGAVAAGGSWYTGKQIEQRYGELVQKANQSLQQLKIYGVQAELKDVQVERGLFSSAARYNLAVKSGDESYEFKGNDTLYHGPLPLNRLMKGNIVPVMASAESNIAVPENLKSYFSQDSLLTGQGALGYSETWNGDYTFSPIKFSEQGLETETSEIRYNGEVAKDGSGKGKVMLPTFKLIAKQNEKPTELQLKELVYDFSFDKTADEYALLGLGKAEVKLKSLIIKDLDSKTNEDGIEFDSLEFNDVVSEAKNQLNGEAFEMKSTVSGKMTLGNKDTKVELGKLSAENLANVDAKLANRLMSYLTNPDTLEQKSDELMDDLFGLFNKGFQYHLNDVALENSKGKSDITLQLNVPEGKSLADLQGLDEVLNLFKQSKLAVKLNRSMAEEAVKQFVSLSPKERDNAEQFAKSRIDELFQSASQSDIAQVNGENIQITLEIDEGKVKLNGNDVPKEQVDSALFMLMFGLGSFL